MAGCPRHTLPGRASASGGKTFGRAGAAERTALVRRGLHRKNSGQGNGPAGPNANRHIEARQCHRTAQPATIPHAPAAPATELPWAVPRYRRPRPWQCRLRLATPATTRFNACPPVSTPACQSLRARKPAMRVSLKRLQASMPATQPRAQEPADLQRLPSCNPASLLSGEPVRQSRPPPPASGTWAQRPPPRPGDAKRNACHAASPHGGAQRPVNARSGTARCTPPTRRPAHPPRAPGDNPAPHRFQIPPPEATGLSQRRGR